MGANMQQLNLYSMFNPDNESYPVTTMALKETNLFAGGNFGDPYAGFPPTDPSQINESGLFCYSTVTRERLHSFSFAVYPTLYGIEGDYVLTPVSGVVFQGADLFVSGAGTAGYDGNGGLSCGA